LSGLLWLVALVLGAAPRRVWHRLEPPLPLSRTAAAAGLLTLILGFVVGIPGFFAFAQQEGAANNDWMLRQLAAPPGTNDAAVGMVPYGMSVLSLFFFLFFTPTGLIALYLVTSGTIRAVAAFIDVEDARGDFVLSAVHRVWTTAATRYRQAAARSARQRLEGEARPDILQTGAWAGVDADYVVLASRRKPEWTAGAIILTGTEWYKLGAPFDIETPAGLRTAYPLTRMETVEVVRRGIEYELPRLRSAGTKERKGR
jgi:hypothetical protein